MVPLSQGPEDEGVGEGVALTDSPSRPLNLNISRDCALENPSLQAHRRWEVGKPPTIHRPLPYSRQSCRETRSCFARPIWPTAPRVSLRSTTPSCERRLPSRERETNPVPPEPRLRSQPRRRPQAVAPAPPNPTSPSQPGHERHPKARPLHRNHKACASSRLASNAAPATRPRASWPRSSFPTPGGRKANRGSPSQMDYGYCRHGCGYRPAPRRRSVA